MKSLDNTKLFFNSRAIDWDKQIKDDDRKKLYEVFANDIPKLKGPVLDLGSGTGILVPLVKSKISSKDKLIELDIARNMLLETKNIFPQDPQINYCTADSHYLPFNSNYFNTVLCYNTFPHFPDKPKVIKEIKRCLSKNGKLFIIHLMCHRQLNLMHSKIQGTVRHDKMLPKTKLQNILLSEGLSIIMAEENPGKYLIIAKK